MVLFALRPGLELLPSTGFMASCSPVKMEPASAGPGWSPSLRAESSC
jgi:hypothetical protein